MEISRREDVTPKGEKVVILVLKGRLVIGNEVQMFRNAVAEELEKQHRRILVDLSMTSYMDATGAGALVGCYTRVRNAGPGSQFRLLNLSPRVKDVLAISKLISIFDVHEDIESARKSFDLS